MYRFVKITDLFEHSMCTASSFIPQNPTDEMLIKGLLTEQDEWVSILYNKARPLIIRYALNNQSTVDEAKDLVQNTVIIVYENILLGKLVLTSSLTTYIFAIAKNLWLKELRKKRRHVMIHLDDADFESENQDDLIEDRIFQLQKAIKELDAKCQEILKSRYWQKKKFDEMSQIYNTTVASLKMKSSRCHESLQLIVKRNG
jgi:RNA polymerase sigma factor (sigma-70 family)